MQYTNFTEIPLVLAVWLAADNGYDLEYKPDVISATTLFKPVRSTILSRRVKSSQKSIDISSLVPSALGTAVHTAVEDAWLYHRDQAMRNLGIPEDVIEKICFNPDPKWGWDDDPDKICIYMEQRTQKTIEVDGITWTISGKFDAVVQGTVEDVKTTKTFNWIKGSNDEKYALQGSIYRWLNPDFIRGDFVNILMMFTDWSELKAKADPTYPQKNVVVRKLPLMSLEETESYVMERLRLLNRYIDKPEAELPQCTPDELWMDPPKGAYYKDKTKLTRATKLCDTAAEAHLRLSQDGNKGTIVKRDMEPKFCRYCDARPVCTQAENYIAQGILKP
jgi:hypothetical protein